MELSLTWSYLLSIFLIPGTINVIPVQKFMFCCTPPSSQLNWKLYFSPTAAANLVIINFFCWEFFDTVCFALSARDSHKLCFQFSTCLNGRWSCFAAARIREGPRSQRVKLRSNLTLSCKVIGRPLPTVKWVTPKGVKYNTSKCVFLFCV